MIPKKGKLYFFDYTKTVPFVTVADNMILWKEAEVDVSETDILLCTQDDLQSFGIDGRDLGFDEDEPALPLVGHEEQAYVFLVKNKFVPVSPTDIENFNMKEFVG